jgi:uncharacterized protein
VLVHDRPRPDIRGLEAEAYEQNGYFRVRQARSHGVSSQLLSYHVRSRKFTPIRRGLYRLQGFPSSAHDDLRESWMAVGQDKAVVSHESALALLDLSDNMTDSTHLLVARRHRGVRRPAGVTLHTRPDGEDVPIVWREGMPLTAPARTIIDTLQRVQPEQAEMAVRQALARGLVTKGQLRAEAAQRGRAGVIATVLERIGPDPDLRRDNVKRRMGDVPTHVDLHGLRARRQEILESAAQHGARNVRVFGSAARGASEAKSDVDLLVEMEPGRSLLDLVALWQELEDLLGTHVDVLSDGGVSPHLRERIYAEAVPL